VEIKIDDLRPHSHLLVNVDRVGYYRVQYDEANWMLIANELSHENPNISPISRAMLINDAGKFYTSGILNVRIFLELTRHLQMSVGAFISPSRVVNNKIYT
jgi:aminopeptidase N